MNGISAPGVGPRARGLGSRANDRILEPGSLGWVPDPGGTWGDRTNPTDNQVSNSRYIFESVFLSFAILAFILRFVFVCRFAGFVLIRSVFVLFAFAFPIRLFLLIR